MLVAELDERELPFLLDLWHIPEVMQYADELPGLRGWSKSEGVETAWVKYQERRAKLGSSYAQMIIHLADGTPIGESFFAPLSEGFTLDRWTKPEGERCLMGDIKLSPEHWNKGLGTQGMHLVVEWLFSNTDCDLLVVPPHGKNPAAIRVYEKSGFGHIDETRPWRGHRIMELWRERFYSSRLHV